MELADPGLNILGRDAMLLHYDTPWGIRTRTYPVAKQRMEGLETLLREKHYELAMQGRRRKRRQQRRGTQGFSGTTDAV